MSANAVFNFKSEFLYKISDIHSSHLHKFESSTTFTDKLDYTWKRANALSDQQKPCILQSAIEEKIKRHVCNRQTDTRFNRQAKINHAFIYLKCFLP